MHFSPPGIRSQNCCQQKMPQSLTESAFFKKCSITPLLGNFRLYQHFLNLYQWYLSGKMLTMNSQLFSIDFAFGLSLYRSKKKKKRQRGQETALLIQLSGIEVHSQRDCLNFLLFYSCRSTKDQTWGLSFTQGQLGGY